MKKIVLSLCLMLLGASVLSGCTKDEVLDQYNNIVQSAGSIALTGNSSLQGTKEKGIDDYTGSYTANYEDFSDTRESLLPAMTRACWGRIQPITKLFRQ